MGRRDRDVLETLNSSKLVNMALSVRYNVKDSMPMALYQCEGSLSMCGQSVANQPTGVNDVASG